MAYANLVHQAVQDKYQAFCRLRDFLCKRDGTYDHSYDGVGWTLFDSSYAVDEDNPSLNDWFVIHSNGEDGGDQLYFQVLLHTNGIYFNGFLSWNPTAHAGSSSYYYGNNSCLLTFANADITKTLFVYADLNFISVLADTYSGGSMYYMAHCGKIRAPNSGISEDFATCSSSLSSGSDVSITVDAVPDSWQVGSEIVIFTTHTDNMATVKMEVVTIKTLVGTTLTADLTNSYTANCKLTHWLAYMVQGNNQFNSTSYCLIDAAGLINQICLLYSLSILLTNCDPSGFEDRYILQPVIFKNTSQGWPIGLYDNIRIIGISTGLTMLDTLDDIDGTSWRYFAVYSSKYIAIREV